MSKKITLVAGILAISQLALAQNRIDANYKKPSLGSKVSTIATPTPFNKDLMEKVYGKSESDKVLDKCQAEYDAFNQNGDEVWIYSDEFFNGEKKILKIGDYTLLGSASTRELGTNWNDRISSMLIPSSLKLTVFMDDKFKGLAASTSGFGVTNMETGTTGFKGDYYTFKSGGKYSKGGLYFIAGQAGTEQILANDNISSIKIYR
ncbi:hypothetical protein [Mucilaginibacter psychrotolerans]|uniref:Uncharacterized protein n=1 Tax=Mucilaginibacter psychrotolerans TaxID=1524096 RepID=A0A4Y8SAH1_9SPHI|nr:hypothetical protein [Mucilaginibacter psychrotolerans]TFF35547.1 hypothetical protein E2R66_18865 [Mucilaginibacter psychrotolerans]